MDESFLDEKDKDGNFVNFHPVFDDVWLLKSVKSGVLYNFYEFTNTRDDSLYSGYHEEYMNKLDECVQYKMFSVFAMHWLKQMLMYEALEYAENQRLKYLDENLVPGLDGKKAGKVHRASEKHQKDSYSKYFEKFLDF